MLFTVLGVIALFLRERTIKSTVSGQEERFDRQEGLVTAPPVTNSDGREIGDWCEDSSLHLEEQINVQTEEPSLEEPVDDHSEESSLVEPDSVHGEEPSLVVSEKPGCSHDDPPKVVSAKPGCSHDDPPKVVSEKPGCSHDDPPNVVSAKPGCSHYPPTKVVPAKPGCKAAAQGATGQTKGAVPHQPKQLNYRNTHIMEINFKMYEIGAKLGKGGFGTVYTGTRIKDRLPVALKVADFKVKQFIQVDDFLQPLPAEIALHFLASKGPKAKPIVKLLDWKVEANRYLLVLERPVPCENLWEFLCKYDGRIPEKILWKIMFHTTIAADICCKRGVLHRDIKAENLLINLRTHQVKLTDFGCGERLTRSCYKEYCGTPQYCPPEFNSTGLYYGEPATVWSLGILQYLLMFKKFPDYHDLQNLTFTNLGQYGWSKECCDFISCCLQTDYQLRSKLQTLRTHDWFKVRNTF
nr:serine/threonine-protein kinase pim-3 [Danio rerio]|eukprot:XP_021335656.1 serine/threonine-protein kinase pim-3 [Danio rerio]